MGDLRELLEVVLARDASDLHLTVGVPPTLRIHGSLVPMKRDSLTSDDTRKLIYSVMSDEQRKDLETELECDFAYSVPGKTRFRVNVYFQRGSVGAAFRLVPLEI